MTRPKPCPICGPYDHHIYLAYDSHVTGEPEVQLDGRAWARGHVPVCTPALRALVRAAEAVVDADDKDPLDVWAPAMNKLDRAVKRFRKERGQKP